MLNLTADEKTVLLIAIVGGPMAPVGRWKAPTESLVAKGFLKPRPHSGDPDGYFNMHITDIGKDAAVELDREDDIALGELLNVASRTGHVQRKCAAHAEQIAVQMVDLIELSITATGASKIGTAKQWGEVIGKRVMEMLK